MKPLPLPPEAENATAPRGGTVAETGVTVKPALTSTETVSHCPYKGQAAWWSVIAGDSVHEDLAWSYPTPLPESQRIAGLISFYNEKTDIYVDNTLQDRPKTKFS